MAAGDEQPRAFLGKMPGAAAGAGSDFARALAGHGCAVRAGTFANSEPTPSSIVVGGTVELAKFADTHRTNIVNPGLSPTTVM